MIFRNRLRSQHQKGMMSFRLQFQFLKKRKRLISDPSFLVWTENRKLRLKANIPLIDPNKKNSQRRLRRKWLNNSHQKMKTSQYSSQNGLTWEIELRRKKMTPIIQPLEVEKKSRKKNRQSTYLSHPSKMKKSIQFLSYHPNRLLRWLNLN